MKNRQRIALNLVWLVALVLCGGLFEAQAQCDEVLLNEASKSYRAGRFTSVISQLQPCLEKGFSGKEKVEGFRLKALSHIALDEMPEAEAAVNQLLVEDPLYDPSIYDLPKFVTMVYDIRAGRRTVQVTSVSKKAENLLEAPATVLVVTDEEIRERGYVDLIDVVQDLPGFDVSKIHGVTYANLYQRGFRQNNTERTLFLIDGVEENDLWTNTAFISRQYPLSNIKRVEVVYGPASTMYGPNAFVGVINVITKTAKDVTGEDKNFGVTGTVTAGSWNTRSADLTASVRKDNISLSITGRVFQSDEMDLSGDPFYDYDKAEFETIDYGARLNVESDAAAYVRTNGLTDGDPLYNIERDGNGDTVAVRLTEAGRQRAVELDQRGYDQVVNDNPIGFSNTTENWLLNAKLRVGDLTMGFQTWKRAEGATPTFTDMNEAGALNGSVWVPKLSFYYVKYDKALSDKLTVSAFTRFKVHEVDEESKAVYVFNYTNANTLTDLIGGVEPLWVEQFYYQLSRQLRVETKVLYTPTPRLDIVGGVEIRHSQLQGNYLNTFFEGNPQDEGTFFFRDPQDPANQEALQQALQGGNQFNIRDIGVYAQGTYRAMDNLRVVLGGRLDNNRVRVAEGFGSQLNPRVALIYTPADYVFKGIYSRGYQNVSNWTKYSTSDIRVANPTVDPEKVQNFEISGARQITRQWVAELALYNSQIDDVVSTVPHPTLEGREWNDNTGTFSVFGAQLNTQYNRDPYRLYLNYTYTNPQDLDNDLRIGDIATHQINAGATYTFFDHLVANLRLNFVGERPVGEETTQQFNPDEFPAFTVLNSAIGYRDIIPGLSAQLVANNLLDNTYYHPGPRSASGTFYTSRSLQRSRHFLLNLRYDF